MRELLFVGRDDERGFVLPTGTVTFLLTDIEGSSSRWDSQPARMAPAVSRHYEIIDDAVVRHHGVRPVEQGEGDSTVAAFSRASDALAAAVEMQRALATEIGDTFSVRIAVHSGEAQLRDEGNYFGVTVIRCARLRALAHGGQTLVSRTTADLSIDSLPPGVALRDLGEVRLRDLGRREHVWQLCHADIQDDFAPLRSVESFATNLPVPITSLVGREAEVAALEDLAVGHRLVSITGTGGAGKTRLALQVGADLLDRFDGAVVWVELAPIADGDRVAPAVLAACGGEQTPGRPVIDSLVLALGDHPTLVILDNCEHVLDAVSHLANTLLQRATGVSIIATSREPLSVPGEVTWHVPSLSTPKPAFRATIESVTAFDSVRLFIERAVMARPNFTVTAENAPLIADICQRLDGIPLAIELAAARVRQLPIERIARGLDDQFRMLTGGARTLMPRQQTLEASIEWSFELLDAQERMVLQRLGTFVGGFTMDLAEDVCADESLDAYAVLDLVSRLVDKSLVSIDDHGRYRLLESVRQFAVGRARQAGELPRHRDRHLDALIRFADRFDLTHRVPTVDDDREIIAEHANALAALEWSMSGDRTVAVDLIHLLNRKWYCDGVMDEIVGVSDRVLGATAYDRRLWLHAFAALAPHNFVAANHASWELADDAAAEAALLGDDYLDGRIGGFAATTRYVATGFTLDTMPAIRKAFDAAERAADPISQGYLGIRTCAWLAAMARRRLLADELGRLPDLLVHERTNYRGVTSAFLGFERGLAGDLAAATELWSGRRHVPPQALAALGSAAMIAAAMHVDRPLIDLISAELRLVADAGMNELLRRRALTQAAFFQQGPGASLAMLTDTSPAARLIDWSSFHWLVSVALSLGHVDVASDAFDTWPVATLIGAPRDAIVLVARSDLARATGEGDVAAYVHDALALSHPEGLRTVVVDALEQWAFHAAVSGRRDRAEAVLRACDDERAATGYRLRFAHHQAAYDDATRDAHDEVPSLTIDQAVAMVQRARGERMRPTHGWASITPAEREVVDLVCSGLTNAAIATQLSMSPNTVKTHLSHVFTKLGVKNRAELARTAVVHDA